MSTLTPRQAEFLALSAQGLRRADIAKKCFLSRWTVDNIFKAARAATESSTNSQAVIKALMTGDLILDLDGQVITRHALEDLEEVA